MSSSDDPMDRIFQARQAEAEEQAELDRQLRNKQNEAYARLSKARSKFAEDMQKKRQEAWRK